MANSKLPAFYFMTATSDNKDLSPELHLYLDQTYQYIEKNLGGNGYVIPSLTSAQITALLNNAAEGTMWFQSDAAVGQKLKIKMDGALKTVTVT